MINPTLYNRIAPVSRRIQWCRALLSLSAVWAVSALLALTLWWWQFSEGKASLVWVIGLLLITLVGSCFGLWIALRGDDEFQRTAHRIEIAYPELNSALVTALEQRRDKTKAIKQGMMQSLLTGRVRLVEPEGAP